MSNYLKLTHKGYRTGYLILDSQPTLRPRSVIDKNRKYEWRAKAIKRSFPIIDFGGRSDLNFPFNLSKIVVFEFAA